MMSTTLTLFKYRIKWRLEVLIGNMLKNYAQRVLLDVSVIIVKQQIGILCYVSMIIRQS